MVDAAHTLFTPVAIYNNTKDDEDAKTRQAFEEPSWNNPVVRIVDTERKDVVKRHANDWSLAGLLGVMKAAREKRGEDLPRWFTLFEREEASRKRGVEVDVFGMG